MSCRRWSCVTDRMELRITSNCPVLTDSLYRNTAATMIQAMGQAVEEAIHGRGQGAALTGILQNSSATPRASSTVTVPPGSPEPQLVRARRRRRWEWG